MHNFLTHLRWDSRPSVIVAIAMAVVAAGCGERADSSSTVVGAARMSFDEQFDAKSIQLSKVRQADLDHVMIDPQNPGHIIPCIKVMRKLVKRAEKDPGLSLWISLRYLSNGVEKFKVVIVPVRDMEATTHHANNDKKTILLETDVDVSNAPVDADSEVTGTVRVVDATPARSFEPGS